MRSDLPQGKERDERDETRRHPLFASRGIIEETGVESLGLADQLLAADLRRSAIEDARVRGLLGDGPFRHAFEIALAIDRERPVVFQAELRAQALGSSARILRKEEQFRPADDTGEHARERHPRGHGDLRGLRSRC